MGKSKKKDKMSSSQKKEAFWEAIMSQQQRHLREGLVNTGIEAQTRNQQGLTSIMYAALNGKIKSLDTLLDWYERRKMLRQKGWLNLTDDNGRTALMLAASRGHLECIASLLEKGAKPYVKDAVGMTARDIAEKAHKMEAVKLLDEMLKDSEEEEEEAIHGQELPDGLTSTQRSKLKKKRLQELERRGAKETSNKSEEKQSESEEEDSGEPMPKPIWEEVKKVLESIEMLRPIHEIHITREDSEALPGGVDPALWYLKGINRLEMSLASGALTYIDGKNLKRLKNLQTLILNKNSLQNLPPEIGRLKGLKFLEVACNELKELPKEINMLKNLELLNVSENQLTDVPSLEGLEYLATLNVSMNKIQSLDTLHFESLGRVKSMIFSDNAIETIPRKMSLLANLMELVGENNKIEEIPFEITALKKIKTLKLDGNPIKDSKVVKMLSKKGKGLKELWKYLAKIAQREPKMESDTSLSAAKDGELGDLSREKDDKEDESDEVDADEVDNDDDDEADINSEESELDSDDSFDITMEEL